MGAVVTVRVPAVLKEDLKKYNVEAAEVARKAWEEEVKRKKLEEARIAAKELGQILADITTKEIVKMIREDRDTR